MARRGRRIPLTPISVRGITAGFDAIFSGGGAFTAVGSTKSVTMAITISGGGVPTVSDAKGGQAAITISGGGSFFVLQVGPTAVLLEIAFASPPLAESPTWTDVSDYFVRGKTRRGRSHELGRTDAGTATFVLDNNDRRFDPMNTASPYYPNLLPLKKIRFSVTHEGLTYRVWTGFVERWPQDWETPNYAEITLTCVDAFDFLNLLDIDTGQAAVTI